LIIASNDPASPVTIPLSGTGTQGGVTTTPPQGGNIALTVNGGNSASVTVQAGLPATYALMVSPINGYSGVVALTCTADPPADYTACSLLPASVMLAAGTEASAASISTVSAVTAGATMPMSFGIRGLLLSGSPMLLVLLGVRRRVAVLLALCLAVTLSAAGCGNSADKRIRYASAGTYTFHVTARSTNDVSASQTVTLTLVITPP
jgi:hypothetical protein